MKDYKTQLSDAVDGIYMLIKDFCEDMHEEDPVVDEVIFIENRSHAHLEDNFESYVYYSEFNTELQKYDKVVVYGLDCNDQALCYNIDDGANQTIKWGNLSYDVQAEIADAIVKYKAEKIKEKEDLKAELVETIIEYGKSVPHFTVIGINKEYSKFPIEDVIEYVNTTSKKTYLASVVIGDLQISTVALSEQFGNCWKIKPSYLGVSQLTFLKGILERKVDEWERSRIPVAPLRADDEAISLAESTLGNVIAERSLKLKKGTILRFAVNKRKTELSREDLDKLPILMIKENGRDIFSVTLTSMNSAMQFSGRRSGISNNTFTNIPYSDLTFKAKAIIADLIQKGDVFNYSYRDQQTELNLIGAIRDLMKRSNPEKETLLIGFKVGTTKEAAENFVGQHTDETGQVYDIAFYTKFYNTHIPKALVEGINRCKVFDLGEVSVETLKDIAVRLISNISK